MNTLNLFNYDINKRKSLLIKKQSLSLNNTVKNKSNIFLIAGMDEAGRGPLAGPVVAACCIMPPKNMIKGIMDSKMVSETNREKLYEIIIKEAVCYSIAEADNKKIDEINILKATVFAMENAVKQMKIKPDYLLVDAVSTLKIEIPYEPIIKGDMTSYNIAAASIIAKVHRDRIMREYNKAYPQFGFITNKGYATQQHIDALLKYGKTDIHRDSFLKNFSVENVYTMRS